MLRIKVQNMWKNRPVNGYVVLSMVCDIDDKIVTISSVNCWTWKQAIDSNYRFCMTQSANISNFNLQKTHWIKFTTFSKTKETMSELRTQQWWIFCVINLLQNHTSWQQLQQDLHMYKEHNILRRSNPFFLD